MFYRFNKTRLLDLYCSPDDEILNAIEIQISHVVNRTGQKVWWDEQNKSDNLAENIASSCSGLTLGTTSV